MMDEIIESIYESPDDWEISQFTFNHKGGFSLWVSDGFIFAEPYQSGMHINFSQKLKIWKAYKWWCKNAPIACVR